MIYNFALLGCPVQHSLSPQIHSEFFKQTQLKGNYICLETKPEDLARNIQYLQKLGFRGVNLTIPHKEAGLNLAQEISQEAALIGATNTLIFDNNIIKAENTDWKGFLESLPSQVQEKSQEVLVLGAGGSAKAIIAALLKTNIVQIHLAIRNSESSQKSSQILYKLIKSQKPNINFQIHFLDNLPQMPDLDLIVNTTPIGMSSFEASQSPLLDGFYNNIKNPNCYFYDLIYSPTKTTFLQIAESKNFRIQNGYQMLYLQAAYAFSLWTASGAV